VPFLADFEVKYRAEQNGLPTQPEAAVTPIQSAHKTHLNPFNVTKHICIRTVSAKKNNPSCEAGSCLDGQEIHIFI
jgi:hypothetical protein